MHRHSFEPPNPICLLCILDKKCLYISKIEPQPLKNIDIIFIFFIFISFPLFNLQFCRYAIGDRLSPDHQRTILQRLLPYHPECDKKIGPGVDYITVCHPPPASFTDLLALLSHIASFSVHLV